MWILLATACVTPRAPALGDAGALVAGSHGTWSVPGWDDRDYILHLPPAYDPGTPVPVVLGFHGGGGDKEGFDRSTCPEGERGSELCLLGVADREGFAVVIPDGVDAPGVRKRSWNAGGGEDGWRCVGGLACASGSDDVAYVDDLLAEVARAVRVDADRIYATGMSNGGAMSHRLACERADVFAAVAPVAGANQAGGFPGCAPSAPVPILHQHGTADPCWGWDGGTTLDLCEADGVFRAVEDSFAEWRAHNGCTGTVEEVMPDEVDDGTTSTRIAGTGCAADTVLVRIDGGGHAWPGGWPYFGESLIGKVPRDFSGTEQIWAFFEAHPRSR